MHRPTEGRSPGSSLIYDRWCPDVSRETQRGVDGTRILVGVPATRSDLGKSNARRSHCPTLDGPAWPCDPYPMGIPPTQTLRPEDPCRSALPSGTSLARSGTAVHTVRPCSTHPVGISLVNARRYRLESNCGPRDPWSHSLLGIVAPGPAARSQGLTRRSSEGLTAELRGPVPAGVPGSELQRRVPAGVPGSDGSAQFHVKRPVPGMTSAVVVLGPLSSTCPVSGDRRRPRIGLAFARTWSLRSCCGRTASTTNRGSGERLPGVPLLCVCSEWLALITS